MTELTAKQRVKQLEAENLTLRNQLEEARRPITDDEWKKEDYSLYKSTRYRYALYMDGLITSFSLAWVRMQTLESGVEYPFSAKPRECGLEPLLVPASYSHYPSEMPQ